MSREEDFENLDHPVLAQAEGYRISGLNYQAEDPLIDEPYIDLTLRRGTDVRCLRFFAPQKLHIGERFPQVGYLRVLDVGKRQWDKLSVWVKDAEQNEAISFYARDVVEVPQVVPKH